MRNYSATEEDRKTIHQIVDFAMYRLVQNGMILIETSDGCLLSFCDEESLADEIHSWCLVKVSLCANHGASLHTRGPVLSSLGFKPIASSDSNVEFEAAIRVDDCYSALFSLLLVGVDAGETNLSEIELSSVNTERDVFGIEKYEFLTDFVEGGDE